MRSFREGKTPPRWGSGPSQSLAARDWRTATLSAQHHSCFPLPEAQLSWLWCLRLAEEDSPNSGLGVGAAEGPKSFMQRVRVLGSQFL